MKIKYGVIETTKSTDDEGSTTTTQTNYHAGEISLPIRIRYKIMLRVHGQEEENEEYRKFSDEMKQDKSMLEPSWSIEHTKYGDDYGYYHVIKAYTRLASDV